MNLNNSNYFSREAESLYLGSSSFKAWNMFNEPIEVFGNTIQGGCEARETAKRNGLWQDKESDALLVGSYVHAWNEGKAAFQKFISEHEPEIFQKNGKLRSDFVRADEMIKTLDKSKLYHALRDSSQSEKIYTGKIAGVDFKIMVDIENIEKGYWADLKTTRKIKSTGWKNGKVSFIDMYNYKTQFAIYSEILRQNLGLAEGNYLDAYLIVVDKQEVPDHEVIFMGTSFIEKELEYIKDRLPRIISVRNGEEKPVRCEVCEYCRSTKEVLKPIALKDFEQSLGIE